MHLSKPVLTGNPFLCFLLLIVFTLAGSFKAGGKGPLTEIAPATTSLYDELGLSTTGLSEAVFQKALAGYNQLKKQNNIKSPVLSIVDFTQSSNSKRLYIIDVEKSKLLFQTWVAHGRNSGNEFANSFSNAPNSYKSSVGFYVTGTTYNGKHGLSLQLKGMETGINDCAEKRAIVMHGAAYVSEDFIKQYGRLGRSQGCPAVSETLSAPIINLIKDGSCFFMYYPEDSYLQKSSLLGN
jgi:L,D-transpeptidase-like protein